MKKTTISKGLTLVELIVALAISTVIMVAVTAFDVNVFRYQKTISGSLESVQDAETILKTMDRELRMASAGSDGSYAVAQASTSAVAFFADINGDGIKERVRYYLTGTTLYRGVIVPTGSPLAYVGANESTSPIMYNVKNASTTPVFQYYDGNYDGSEAALSQPVTSAAIRLVNIDLILLNPQASSTKAYSTSVTFRNLKSNL